MTRTIAVIGGGTAGLATCIALSRKGYRSTLFEKHGSPSARGAGLLIQPAGVDALRALGVGPAFEEASTPIERLLGRSHRVGTVVDVRYGSRPARAVSRGALSALLYADALSCGVDFRFNARVSSLSQTQDKVELVADSWCGSYDALVIADGADSELRVQAGLGIRATPYPWGALWGLFDVKSWPYGTTLLQHYKGTRQMFGLMPTQVTDDRTTLSFFWSLKHAEVDGWRAASLDAFREMLVGLWPESVPVVEQLKTHSQLAVARYQHAWPRRLGVPRIFIAGDSAHSMSPSLGLGSTLAVQDALAIAQCLETSGPVDGPQAYSKVRLGRIQRFQWLSRALTPCFQSDGEGLGRDLIFGLGARLAPVRWLMRQSLSA